jgi:hypothetical protein
MSKSYRDVEGCSGCFTARFGLPYKHYLHNKIEEMRKRTEDLIAAFYIKLAIMNQH